MKWQSILVTAIYVISAVNGFAGILYLEVPENITAEMVRNPSGREEAFIEDFVISEVNKIDKDWVDRVVWLTKDGEPLLLGNETDIYSL